MGIGNDASEVGLSHGALAPRVFARLFSCLALRAVAKVSVVARAGVKTVMALISASLVGSCRFRLLLFLLEGWLPLRLWCRVGTRFSKEWIGALALPSVKGSLRSARLARPTWIASGRSGEKLYLGAASRLGLEAADLAALRGPALSAAERAAPVPLERLSWPLVRNGHRAILASCFTSRVKCPPFALLASRLNP